MTEATLTKQVVRRLKTLKAEGEPIEWLKVLGGGMQRAGEPDFSITYYGRSVKAELKVGDNKLTKLQTHRLKQWSRAGAVTGVVRTVADLDELLTEAKG